MHHAAKVLLILLLNHGAATFDAWSTRYMASRYPGGYEANPLERPFVNSNALYLTSQVDATIADFLFLHKWKNRKLQIAASLFEGGTSSGHIYAGIHNLRLGRTISNLELRNHSLAPSLDPPGVFPTGGGSSPISFPSSVHFSPSLSLSVKP